VTGRQDRIATVLRVRRAQEADAASGLARAGLAAREAERVLGALHQHYDRHRDLDAADAPVPDRLRDRERRLFQAQAIQAGRARVRDALAAVEEHQRLLQARTQAVRAMERLDERLRAEQDALTRLAERRELDERASQRHRAQRPGPEREGRS
jgi:flagellar biosynthesis chaperone FliJ